MRRLIRAFELGMHRNQIRECAETGRQGSDSHLRSGEFLAISHYCWEKGTLNSLTANLQMQMGKQVAMRSDNIEGVFRNHIAQSVVGDQSMGTREFKGVRIISFQSKTNRCGLIEETGLIPHKNPFHCGVLSLAVSEFLLWTVQGKLSFHIPLSSQSSLDNIVVC
jgi:hypothetical protein